MVVEFNQCSDLSIYIFLSCVSNFVGLLALAMGIRIKKLFLGWLWPWGSNHTNVGSVGFGHEVQNTLKGLHFSAL
jgi:hypothetical protein